MLSQFGKNKYKEEKYTLPDKKMYSKLIAIKTGVCHIKRQVNQGSAERQLHDVDDVWCTNIWLKQLHKPMGNDGLFGHWCWENLLPIGRKIKSGFLTIAIYKGELQCIKNPGIKF